MQTGPFYFGYMVCVQSTDSLQSSGGKLCYKGWLLLQLKDMNDGDKEPPISTNQWKPWGKLKSHSASCVAVLSAKQANPWGQSKTSKSPSSMANAASLLWNVPVSTPIPLAKKVGDGVENSRDALAHHSFPPHFLFHTTTPVFFSNPGNERRKWSSGSEWENGSGCPPPPICWRSQLSQLASWMGESCRSFGQMNWA